MRKISANKISEIISKMCMEINFYIDKKESIFLKKLLKNETNPLAKKVLSYMLQNADLAVDKQIPLCQDTGAVVIFMEIGQDVYISGNLGDAVNLGVKEGYEKGYLRKSMVVSPIPGFRKNTNDNTPAMLYTEIVPGDKVKIKLAVKGAGSENMSAIKMFKPTASWEEIEQFILDTIKKAGSNPCPPIIAGIGIGGTFEKCAILSKKASIRNLSEKNKDKKISKLEKDLLLKINKLNIGPLGMGGGATALSVNIETYPCHIASLPVAVNLNCFAFRHATAEI